MRRGVAKDEKRFIIFFGKNLELEVLLERAAQIDQVTAVFGRFAEVYQRPVVRIGLGDERGVGQARRDAACDVRRGGAFGNVLDTAIRQSDVNGIHFYLRVCQRK